MREIRDGSLFGPVLEQVAALWRELTAPVSADFIGMPHTGQAEEASDRLEPRAGKDEADFADYYRWMQL